MSLIYFCPEFICCPYYRGVRYSGVSARRELTVVLSNIQNSWLSRKLKASVQSKVMQSILVFQKQYLKGNFSRDYTKYDNNDNNNNNNNNK